MSTKNICEVDLLSEMEGGVNAIVESDGCLRRFDLEKQLNSKQQVIKTEYIDCSNVALNTTGSALNQYYAILTPDYSPVSGTILLTSIIALTIDSWEAVPSIYLGGIKCDGNRIAQICVHSSAYQTIRVRIVVLYTEN